MSAGGKRQGGIKAYKGTIESAVQTLSFLITFICGGDRGGGGIVREEGEAGERNMREETGDLVIPSDLQQKKKGRTVFFFDTPVQRSLQRKIACRLLSLQIPS